MTSTGEDVFFGHRPALLGLAYRMLGSWADAEDVVSETYVRWHAADRDAVVDPRAFLFTVTTRLAIDTLRSARRQREHYVGPWLPEPVLTATGPAATVADDPQQRAELRDTLSLAFLTLLEQLSATERAVFVLREAFEFPHAEIAQLLELSDANVRQVYRRAQQRLGDGAAPRFRSDPARQRELVDRFLAASLSGDVDSLASMLAEDAMFVGDGGGKVSALRKPLVGRDDFLRFFLGLVRLAPPDTVIEIVEANGTPAMLVRVPAQMVGLYAFDWDGDTLRAIHAVRNPDKLTLPQAAVR